MRTLKLVLAYEGTPFVGWQRQAEGVSVQSLLEGALARVEGRAVPVTGAGRTDAGVHALGQVASCALEHPIPVADLRRALNAMLPPEIRVTAVEEAPPGFHARYSARGKTYRYVVLCADAASPFVRRYAWHVSQPLDAAAMAAAARLLQGVHDFAAFQSAGGSAKTTRRTIFSSKVSRFRAGAVEPALGCVGDPEPASAPLGDVQFGPAGLLDTGDPSARLILYEVSGDGFLRHMVRAIVGSLVEVGAGRQPPAWIGELLESGRRGAAGPTAPAHGLWLVAVDY